MKIKKIIKNFLGLNKPKNTFTNSQSYWENRYKKNGNSGSGSYGQLALFKADVLNTFVKNKSINNIVELGSGDGNQLKLATYPNYVGYDVSVEAIKICNALFANDNTRKFVNYNEIGDDISKYDLSLSLDVIYHLIEDDVFNSYMVNLFNLSKKYVVIYASDYDKVLAPHVKCRKFSVWIEKNLKNTWVLDTVVKNKFPFKKEDPDNTSMSNFYIYKRKNA